MDNTVFVGVFKRLGDGNKQADSFLPGDGVSQALFERAAWEVIHHQVRDSVLLAVVIDVDDVRVRQARQCLGLTLERFRMRSSTAGANWSMRITLIATSRSRRMS